MLTPARHLRAEADNNPANRPHLTARERERRAHILATGATLMARYGRHAITLGTFAIAVRMSPVTIRRYVADLDALLAEIVMRHLKELCAAIGAVPPGPQAEAARRAAYLSFTRTPCQGHVPRHTLLLRDRHMLPPDLLAPIEEFRDQIGDLLAPGLGDVALTLLDEVALHAPQVETILAALASRPLATQSPVTKPPAARPTKPAPQTPPTRLPTPAETPLWETCLQARAGPH